MLIRNRQGWRLLIVLSRLAVAGLLSAGLTEFLHPDFVLAQTEAKSPPQPPPTILLRPPDRDFDPAEVSPAPPSTADPVAGTTTVPTPAASINAATALPSLLTLPAALERLSTQRNSLNQVLCKDRRHHLLLQRGAEALSRGDVAAALQNLQALSDATYDAFYWPDDSAVPQGARASVESLIRSLPAQARRDYEQLRGSEARALVTESVTAEGSPCLVDLLRRFPQTQAACEVMQRELLRAFDAGQTALARQFAQRLAADGHHWSSLQPPVQSLARRLLDADQPVYRDVTDRSFSPPALRPRWSYSFTDGLAELPPAIEATPVLGEPAGAPASGPQPDARVLEAIITSTSEWLGERRERRLPVATANQASVFRDLLIVRDFAGLRAMDVHSGQLRWRRPTSGALARVVADHLRTGGVATLNFQTHFSGAGSLGQLTSDGQRVFYLEDQNAEAAQFVNAADGKPAVNVNRLVALPLHSPTMHAEPVWTHPCSGRDSLSGHWFLGPPLPVNGRLFVLSETAARLECIALDASDGRVLWRQPIALAPSPIAADTARLRLACSPVYAASTVICPTEVGVLVGVDPLTGSLQWVYDHIDDDQRLSAGRWSCSTQRNFGNSELPSRTLVHDGRVLHLPFRSESIHCVDAATGKPLWTAPRQGALGLSAIDEENVLLIGPREVTSLAPADGTLRWTAPCPEPAGHGLIAGDAYLFPLADGRCLALSLEDGRPQGARFGRLLHQLTVPEDEPIDSSDGGFQLVSYRPASPAEGGLGEQANGGNLTAAGDQIVVTRPAEVAVYPMSATLLAELEEESDQQRLTEEQQFEAAMLHLLLEDRATARSRLQELLLSDRSPSVTRRATRLLREVLFAELESADDPRTILTQLEQLPAGESAAQRLLVHRIDVAIRLSDMRDLIAALDELQTYRVETLIDRDGQGGFKVNPWCDAGDRLCELCSSAAGPPAAVLDRYVSSVVELALKSGDAGHRRRIVRLFDGWPQVGALRNELAATDIASGRLQQAELSLLKNCSAADRNAAAQANRLLVELYASAGLHREAAAHLDTLADEFRDADVGGGLRGQEFAQQFSDPGVRQIVARRHETSAAAQQVHIIEHICGEECGTALQCASTRALGQHERIRRKFLTSDESSLTVIDRGIITADRSHSTLALIDRESGRLQGEVDVPAAYWHLAGGGEGYVGQLLPVSGRSVHGLSLLEKRCLWSSSDEDDPQRDKVKIGPIGHDFCVLQTSRRLTVLDPATGEVLWFRDDLSPEVGLLSNESTGVIGNGETLTLFNADQVSYTVFRMHSGRLVRRGRLDLPPEESRRHRRAVGDRLVQILSDDEADRLRVWDAGSNVVLIDIPLHERLVARIPECDRYAGISIDGELLIVDIARGQIELRVPLSAEQLADAGELHVTVGPDGYIVNLVGCDTVEAGDIVAAMDEVELPAMRVQGLLMSVSHGGRIQWSRPVTDAALLTSTHDRQPVLTLISRMRDADLRQPAMLRVEVLDIRSGESLAVRSDLLRTRLVQVEDQFPSGRLKLIGLDSQIDIDFGPSRPEMRIHAEVDPPNESQLR